MLVLHQQPNPNQTCTQYPIDPLSDGSVDFYPRPISGANGHAFRPYCKGWPCALSLVRLWEVVDADELGSSAHVHRPRERERFCN